MICPACHRETKPVLIGSGEYCTKCGQRIEARTGGLPIDRPRGMDLTRARHPRPQIHPREQRPRPAHAPANALDLRNIQPKYRQNTPPVRSTASANPETKAELEKRHDERIAHAKRIERSSAISRFSEPDHHEADHMSPVEAHATNVSSDAHRSPELPQATVTHHEVLARLIDASKHETQSYHKPHNRRGRVAATTAAIAIMGGYIWLQNYPKLALQSASSRSGIQASLPGYLPSSYSLAGTNVESGLVTLNFKSPSQNQALTIKQNRTAWDSASLLDNFVSANTSQYTAVQQQGLTIYLMDNNVATWVNHGIWYTISGVERLSRDQVLKIAYSL